MKKIAMVAWVIAGFVALQTIPLMNHVPWSSGLLAQASGLISVAIRPIFALLAAWIVSRQPRNVTGWLLFLPATAYIVNVQPYIQSFTVPPEPPPLGLLFALWYANSGWLQLIFPLFFIPVLFPTGRPPSPRWRWLIIAGLGMCAFFVFISTFATKLSAFDVGMNWEVTNPIGFIPLEAFMGAFFTIWGIGLAAMAVLSVASLFVRYRRAAAVEREQIKWLLYACAVFAVCYTLSYPVQTVSQSANLKLLSNIVWQVSLIGIPLSITIAILRYRLWDIDLIIRRTLQYGVLTLLLGLVYFGLIVLLGQFFLAFSGQESPLVVVISTLAIAALFTPLRRRIQEVIDRRFYRQKYNAEQAVANFAAAARSEVELEMLAARLAGTASESLQPEGVWVWIRKIDHREMNKKGAVQ